MESYSENGVEGTHSKELPTRWLKFYTYISLLPDHISKKKAVKD